MTTVATYQQTFISGNDATKKDKFRFERVYKPDPSYRIRITCESLVYMGAQTTAMNPQLYFLEGLPAITGKTNILRDATTTQQQSQGWFLGSNSAYMTTTKQTSATVYKAPYLLLDDLPLNEFTIGSQFMVGGDTSQATKFAVTFLIEVLEP